jgi:hypothetical protein
MDDAKVEAIIRQYLPQVVHMSLATCAEGKPWVCEVHFAFDEELNLYWQSSQERRHSVEVDKNANVAGNIITQHFMNQKVRGVYFEGTAEKLEGVDEAHPGYVAYAKRYSKGPELLADWSKDGGARLYKIAVSDYYLFDAYANDPPQKFRLGWNK